MGSDIGQSVAWMLARLKASPQAFGRKVVSSIGIFHAQASAGIDAEELEKYCTPVLAFKIEDDDRARREARKAHEMH